MVNLSHTSVVFFLLFFGKAFAEDTIPEACTEQFDSLVNCTALLPDLGLTCLGCWSTTLPQGATDCSDGESKFCATFASCDCENCDSQVAVLSSCLFNEVLGGDGCEFDCEDFAVDPDAPTASPPQTGGGGLFDVCPTEFNALVVCTIDAPDGDECLDCWEQQFPTDVTTCSEGNSQICAASEKCQCASCGPEIVAYTDCLLDEVVGGDGCQLDCATTGNPDTGAGDTSGDFPNPVTSTLALIAGTFFALTLVG